MSTILLNILTALLCCEIGQNQNDNMLLLALIAFAAVVMILVLGPQVTMVYAQANGSGGH